MNDFSEMTVLITGATRGIGKAIGFEFARQGAQVFLTYKWGSVDPDEVADEFRQAGLPEPHIVQSDVGESDEVRELMEKIHSETGRLDVIVSNVSFAKIVDEFDELKRAALEISLKYSAWPIVDLAQISRAVMGKYPKYLLAMSSDGPDFCHYRYDFVGSSKAVLETLCKYMAVRLRSEGVRVNAPRVWGMVTQSSVDTFGPEVIEACKGIYSSVQPDDVARVCLGLRSGWMDAISGQVINVDEAWSLVSPLAYITGRGLPGEFPEKAEMAGKND